MADSKTLALTTAALIIGNLVPLVGVLFFEWTVFVILLLFWAENLIIGAINVSKHWILYRKRNHAMLLLYIPFFCLHYRVGAGQDCVRRSRPPSRAPRQTRAGATSQRIRQRKTSSQRQGIQGLGTGSAWLRSLAIVLNRIGKQMTQENQVLEQLRPRIADLEVVCGTTSCGLWRAARHADTGPGAQWSV